jgi:hypothetical protein
VHFGEGICTLYILFDIEEVAIVPVCDPDSRRTVLSEETGSGASHPRRAASDAKDARAEFDEA